MGPWVQNRAAVEGQVLKGGKMKIVDNATNHSRRGGLPRHGLAVRRSVARMKHYLFV